MKDEELKESKLLLEVEIKNLQKFVDPAKKIIEELELKEELSEEEKKTFKIFTWVATSNTTYGLGVEIGTSTSAPSEREEQYGVIRIEKLK